MSEFAIICVDDEKIVLNSLKDELKSILTKGMTLEMAESGDEAFEIVEEFEEENISLAVVISDQIMPGMKGDELLIKLHAKFPETVKILLTGQADADAVGNAMNNASLYRYISKPWDAADLAMTVKQGIEKYQLDRQLVEQKKMIEDINANIVGHFASSTEIEMSDEELFEKVFFERFLHFLEPAALNWVIKACIGLVNADGKVSKKEMNYMHSLVSTNKDKEQVHQIIEIIKARKIPQLNVLKVGIEQSYKILEQLMQIAITDGTISKKEADYIKHLGGKLGLTPEIVEIMIKLVLEKIKTKQKSAALLKSLANTTPVYATY
ncbi:MAG: response regulator [SAR324 cluster bacterium]|nr:response regulator [SAR324 cluster bacterium]